MPIRNIRRGATLTGDAGPNNVPIYVDSDDNILKMVPAGSGTTEVQVVDASSAQTLTNKTLTAPVLGAATVTTVNKVTITAPATAATLTLIEGTTVTGPAATGTLATLAGAEALTNKTLTAPIITAPVGASSTGMMVTKRVLFTENATNTVHTGTVAIPAGAWIHTINVTNQALWGAASAVFKVGDTAVTDGYFIGVDCKATDLLVGEVLATNATALWGGKNGAYLVAATGQRGPTTTNFGQYYAAGTNIIGTMTVGTPGATTGRTIMSVTYSVGEALAAVASA